MSREELTVQLLNVFRQYGYEGTSLSQISKVTGLGKASLYHYFPGGKEEMAEAALDYVDNCLEENILEPLQSDTPPLERLQVMCEQVKEYYDKGRKSCLWAVLTLEQSSDRFHTHIKQGLSRWIDAIADVLQQAGIDAELARYRAEEAILRIQGALVLARALGNTAPFERTIKSLAEELLQDGH